ncbi:MAG TPA: T9SS type A sorting domain-containing protein [Bacteroidales bacterium]|nr:T9SS type A sorting domain-containing protein [Bacteroidales bacterium]MDI9574118.1 T9SS type A sorting domain-containing protein [Bacteroidota bacterium]MBP9511674.1 T9SS type A sorting domain-containing protein [Bacteroidales bacterium]MBP9589262.1 T9SS type A sorting domain-containing protein [Bacteroidales bacterium]HOE58963.1 T9SS type A sorting domain-containing protein [Bacteroidales bacterium]
MAPVGLGCAFHLDSFENPIIESISFLQTHYIYVPHNRSHFCVGFMDMHTMKMIDSLGPLITPPPPRPQMINDTVWVRNIPLNLKKFQGYDSLLIMIIPLGLYPTLSRDIGPALTCDNCPTSSGHKHSYKYFFEVGYFEFWRHGEFYIELTILDGVTGKRYVLKPGEKPAYNIFRWQETLPLNYQLMTAEHLADTFWMDTEVSKGWYDYFIEATYSKAQTYYSDTVRVYFPTSEGVEESTSGRMRIWPNPVRDVLFIESKEPIIRIEVYNMQGIRVMQEALSEVSSYRLSMQKLHSGMYHVCMFDKKGSRSVTNVVVRR